MLAKSEVVLLTVAVLGTLAAWLSGPHPSLVRPIHDEPSIAALLVEGNSHISHVIKSLTQSAWSHAALYVGPRRASRAI